jgi:ATP-dependent protease ClpP protease subunit
MPDHYRFWGKAKPQRPETFFNVATPRASEDGTTATIRMYGPIDSWGGIWGVSAEEVSEALDAMPDTVTNIQLRINSPGGEGWEGLAILNMLRAHPAKVTAIVDGLAASAASFIAAGCDETVMSPGTQMMIHDAWGLAIGNAGDLTKAAKFLNSVSDSIADLYVEAAGGYRAKWRALMTEETWFTAKEAVAAGLADRVGVVPDEGVSLTVGDDDEGDTGDGGETDDMPAMSMSADTSKFDLSMYRYAGRDEAPEPRMSDDTEETPAPADGDEGADGDEQSADDAAAEAAAPEAAAEPAAESADEFAMTAMARLSQHENAARFAFGG